MHPVTTNAPGYWHAWGSHMVHALAEAGAALNRQDWIDSAAHEANTFMMRQLAFENINEIGVLPRRLGQIAYGTDMMVQGYMALYRATGDEKYARYAGLAASWFFGNNMAGVPMYDPETGRCFDGIDGPVDVARQSQRGRGIDHRGAAGAAGRQSTIRRRRATWITSRSRSGLMSRVEAEYGHKTAGKPDFRTRDWTGEAYFSGGQYYSLGAGDVLEVEFEVPACRRLLDLCRAAAGSHRQRRDHSWSPLRAPSPLTIDGALDEWADVPVFSANTARQFLRGAALWRGPDVDSFDLQIMWDDDNLYLAATVRDPVFEQPEIGPSCGVMTRCGAMSTATGAASI